LAEIALTKVYNPRSKPKKIWFIKPKESIKPDAKVVLNWVKQRVRKMQF